MRNLKAIMAAAFLSVATSASAQTTTAQSASSEVSSVNNGWNTVSIEWTPGKLSFDAGDSWSFNGLSLGYSRAISVSKTIPLYVEAGLGLQYSFLSKMEKISGYYNKTTGTFHDTSLYGGTYVNAKVDIDGSLFTAKVPVELLYAWQIPDSKVTLIPHAGINLRFNVLGKAKVKAEVSGNGILETEEHTYNLFNEDDMEGTDNMMNRFQIGWQIGLKARFNNLFMLGLSYEYDSEIFKKANTKGFSVTAGLTF